MLLQAANSPLISHLPAQNRADVLSADDLLPALVRLAVQSQQRIWLVLMRPSPKQTCESLKEFELAKWSRFAGEHANGDERVGSGQAGGASRKTHTRLRLLAGTSHIVHGEGVGGGKGRRKGERARERDKDESTCVRECITHETRLGEWDGL
jgi:hypothetical protein